MSETFPPDRKFAFGTKVLLIVAASILFLFVGFALLLGLFLSYGPAASPSLQTAINAERLAETFVKVHQGREGVRFDINSSGPDHFPGRRLRLGREYNVDVSHPEFSFNLVWGKDVGRDLVEIIKPCDRQCAVYSVKGNAPPLYIFNVWLAAMEASICNSERQHISYWPCGDGRQFQSLMLSQTDGNYLIVFRQ